MTTATLRDGSEVQIRPIEPDDRAALVAGHARLSPQSRYRRFFGPKPRLTERDLDYLTIVDHHDHEALVALDAETGEGVGVARFVRVGPETAEPAIVVVDDWQGRGVATLLLDALADRAREEGIRCFDAPVLATNRDAIRVFERLGQTQARLLGQEVELHVELDEAPPPRSLLREFAAGTLEPARTLLDLVWPRRRGAPGDPRRNVVVVGTDGSGQSDAAVEVAATLAGLWGAAVRVVGVHRYFVPEQAEVREAVARAAERLRERGLHVDEDVRRGDPALVLTGVAVDEEARLVVVGATGRGGAARRILGSVADAVAERAPCDVLVVRPPDGETAETRNSSA